MLSKPEELALLPATGVAEHLGLSQSTVIRFATALGYNSYPAFRKALQDPLRQTPQAPAQRLKSSQATKGQDAVARSFEDDRDKLAATIAGISQDELRGAIKSLVNARRVYLVGLRASFSVTSLLDYYFAQVLDNVVLMDGSRGQDLDPLLGLSPDDVVLGVSFPRYTRMTVLAMEVSREAGATTIAITDTPLSPLAPCSNHLFCSPSAHAGLSNSVVGAMAIANALVAGVSVERQRKAVSSLEELERLLGRAQSLFETDVVRRPGRPPKID